MGDKKYNHKISKWDVLEILGQVALTSVDVIDAILSGYGRMSRKDYGNLKRRERTRRELLSAGIEMLKEKQKIYNLLSKLKKDGLITQKEKRGGSWSATLKGLSEIKQFQEKQFPDVNYSSQPSQFYTLIVFDIREKERSKRHWLRLALTNMKFRRLQNSVWIAKMRVPKKFIKDLDKLRLLYDVKIFAVQKIGNIEDYNLVNWK